MYRIQMMEPATGVYHELAKEFTSFRKMDLVMKPRLVMNGETYTFVGFYKGLFYGPSDGVLLNFVVINESGQKVNNSEVSMMILGLYRVLEYVWFKKAGVRDLLDNNVKISAEDLTHFIEAIEKIASLADVPSDQFQLHLEKLKEAAVMKLRKRKKLPYRVEDLKKDLYVPFNAILEKEVYTPEEAEDAIKVIFDEDNIMVNSDIRDWMYSLWIA